ncbi:MAG: DUF3604 domain-containing protein [Polyangiales bacterium]
MTAPRRAALALALACAACDDDVPRADASADAPAADAPAPDVSPVVTGPDTRAPCRERDPLRRPFFGDLHVHTSRSFDAATWGTRARPDDAYRFARGEAVGLYPYDAQGRPTRQARLTQPLDFAAVTDHAEFLGETDLCTTPGSPAYDSAHCRDQRTTEFVIAAEYARVLALRGGPGVSICRDAPCAARRDAVWTEAQDAAERAYDRTDACRFTSFVAYEWTASPGGNNLHRNVLFRNRTVPRAPTSYVEAATPDGLWRALERDCLATGTACDVLAVPHNSNQSAGLMFATRDDMGRPYDRAAAERRARLEPLVEIFQHKGSSECIRGAASLLASEDEACAFEQLTAPPCVAPNDPPGCTPLCSVSGGVGLASNCVEPKDFVRAALRRGLESWRALGADPFHLGFVASTDTHNGTPGLVDEQTWPGHAARGDDTPAGLLAANVGRPITIRYNNPGGLAVLWAEENTRDALFEAMRRREAYATSGPRMVVRFFAGWALPADHCAAPDYAARGYAAGVPMGATLPPRPAGVEAPTFSVNALRDPMGGALGRVEIVKLWADDAGSHERVYEVTPGSAARVDVATCAVTGSGDAASRCGLWRDPDFRADVPAAYYARVFEEPACRWSRRVCNAARVDCATVAAESPLAACCRDTLPDTIEERAWTSPVWYLPPRA